MKKILLISFLCFCTVSFSQGPPPTALEPSSENKKLIIALMDVTNYESFFVNYCMKKIEVVGAERKLSSDKILEYKNNVNFNQFMNSTIFNHFAVYSKEELQEMIALCRKLNSNKKGFSDVFFTTGSIQSNLELEIAIYMEE